MLVLSLIVSACPMAFATDISLPVESANEISREEYIAVMAKEKKISYEEAEMLDEEQSLHITRASDEVIRYTTLEKRAGSIYNGKNYTKTVNIVVYAKYLYNNETRKPVELIEISAPYAYIYGVIMDRTTFDHGDYAITRDSTTKSTVVVNGSFVYTDPGVSVSVGGNILGVSTTAGDCVITTKAITLKSIFYLSDCA